MFKIIFFLQFILSLSPIKTQDQKLLADNLELTVSPYLCGCVVRFLPVSIPCIHSACPVLKYYLLLTLTSVYSLNF